MMSFSMALPLDAEAAMSSPPRRCKPALALDHQPQDALQPFPSSERFEEQVEEIDSQGQPGGGVIDPAIAPRGPEQQSEDDRRGEVDRIRDLARSPAEGHPPGYPQAAAEGGHHDDEDGRYQPPGVIVE